MLPVLVKRHPVERQGPLYFAPSDARVRKEDASVGLPLHITIFIASPSTTSYNTVSDRKLAVRAKRTREKVVGIKTTHQLAPYKTSHNFNDDTNKTFSVNRPLN